MSDQYLVFHTFPDQETTNDFADKLQSAGINHKVEKSRGILDPGILGTTSDPDFSIKLLAEDFEKAHKVMEEFYVPVLDKIDQDYYLYPFTDEELFEIIAKPDEWGYLDYQLAQKLLREKGREINTRVLQEMKTERKKNLSEPEKAGISLYILTYVFIVAGVTFLISPEPRNTFYSCFIIISIFISSHIAGNKKILPDGTRVYTYNEKDRSHGRQLFYLSVLILIAVVIRFVLFYSGDNY